MNQSVKLVAVTQPRITVSENELRYLSPDEFIAYCARVSNPANQMNNETSSKLIRYLLKNKHHSPLEMVSITMEIKTTRDIGRQILRHRSFSFQEFSQRYAKVAELSPTREARLQDSKNRQNSLETDDQYVTDQFKFMQQEVVDFIKPRYEQLLEMGIAKEQARAILPEGLTESTLYMAGTLRSWVHYVELRSKNGTQKEHMEIAIIARDILCKEFPSIADYLLSDEK